MSFFLTFLAFYLRCIRPGCSHLLCPCYFYVFLVPYLTDSVSLISSIVVVLVLDVVVVVYVVLLSSVRRRMCRRTRRTSFCASHTVVVVLSVLSGFLSFSLFFSFVALLPGALYACHAILYEDLSRL